MRRCAILPLSIAVTFHDLSTEVSDLNFQQVPEVFVVDPQIQDYDGFVCQVRRYGYRVFLARDGSQGIQLRQTTQGGLWFIHLRLPDMAGWDLHALVKQRYPRATFCLIDETYQVEDELRARQKGFAFFDTKPPKLSWLQHWRHFRLWNASHHTVKHEPMLLKTGQETFPVNI